MNILYFGDSSGFSNFHPLKRWGNYLPMAGATPILLMASIPESIDTCCRGEECEWAGGSFRGEPPNLSITISVLEICSCGTWHHVGTGRCR